MTKEEKDLLLKDLCGRLPYGVIVAYKSPHGEGDIKLTCNNIGYALQLGNGWWSECKPYLRPMRTLTEEESEELSKMGKTMFRKISVARYKELANADQIEWLDEHMFDYRGLIPMGLALELTDW